MTTAAGKLEDAGAQMLRLLEDGIDALAHLDVESLELLQAWALQVKHLLDRREAVDVSLLEPLQSRRRVFAEVLRTTGDHMNLLRRMNGRGNVRTGNGVSPWDR